MKLVVANTGDDSLSIIDLDNYCVTETLLIKPMINNLKIKNVYINGTGIGPHDIKLGRTKDVIYSVNSFHNSIFKININDKKIEDIVYVGSSPSHIVISKNQIFVTNSDSNSVSVIDRDSFDLIANLPVGEKPHDLKLDFKRRKLYVANNAGHSIHVISLENFSQKEIKMNSNPLHMFIGEKYLFVLSSQVNGSLKSSVTIVDINSEEIKKKIMLEGVIIDMVVIEKENKAYLANIEDGYLYEISIDSGGILRKYYIGGMPNNILWNEDGILFITNALENYISIFDINKEKILKNIKVGIEPCAMMFWKMES